jgi:hypothetical protein
MTGHHKIQIRAALCVDIFKGIIHGADIEGALVPVPLQFSSRDRPRILSMIAPKMPNIS